MRYWTITALLSLLVAGSKASACYSNSGLDSSLIACDNTTTTSSCCPYGWYCYSNGLCQNPNTTHIDMNSATGPFTIWFAMGCTDSQASTGECLAYNKCHEQAAVQGTGLTDCGNGNYTCYGLKGDGGSCSDPSTVFHLGSGYVISSIPASAATASPAASSSYKSLATSKTISTSTTTSTSTPAASSGGPGNNIGVGAGVGVGVAAAVLLLAALVFCLWRRKHKKTTKVALPQMMGDDHIKNSHIADAKYGRTPDVSPVHPSGTRQVQELEAVPSPAQLDVSRARWK